MTTDQLVYEISDTLSSSNSLPATISEKEIKRLIKDATRWFYRNYGSSVELKYYMIDLPEFQSDEFKKNKYLVLPSCVETVSYVREIRGGRTFNVDQDFADGKILAAEIYLSPSMSGENLLYRTVQLAYYDLSRSFYLDHIQYGYNHNTRHLSILGRTPRYSVLLRTFVRIPEENLYEDQFFIRYVRATSKISLGHLLSRYNFTLPSNVTINGSDYISEGQTELEQIKQEIDDENPPTHLIMYN